MYLTFYRARVIFDYTSSIFVCLRHDLIILYSISRVCSLTNNNFNMSSTEETSQLKAGHPPAVKAGGMRITQHKTPHTKPDSKEPANEDLTGLSGPSPVPTNPISIAGAPNRGNADFTPEAAQVAHSPKPPAHIVVAPRPNIQQPRK